MSERRRAGAKFIKFQPKNDHKIVEIAVNMIIFGLNLCFDNFLSEVNYKSPYILLF